MDEIDKNKLPNFLIVGAPKCGTTSLYYYLKQHPDIFMPTMKEPRFFLSETMNFPHQGIDDRRVDKMIIKNLDDYKKIYLEADQEKARGDASAGNLYFYKKVIPGIKAYLGDPKIIISLRNPLDRAFSNYTFNTKYRPYQI